MHIEITGLSKLRDSYSSLIETLLTGILLYNAVIAKYYMYKLLIFITLVKTNKYK